MSQESHFNAFSSDPCPECHPLICICHTPEHIGLDLDYTLGHESGSYAAQYGNPEQELQEFYDKYGEVPFRTDADFDPDAPSFKDLERIPR